MSTKPGEVQAKEISVNLTRRLRKHAGNPKYKALAERLEDHKNRYQQGLLLSIDVLKELLALAKGVVKMERETPVEENIVRGKSALTELFEEVKNRETPIMVREVDDIDEIVRAVRCDGWQATHAGEREVKRPFVKRSSSRSSTSTQSFSSEPTATFANTINNEGTAQKHSAIGRFVVHKD